MYTASDVMFIRPKCHCQHSGGGLKPSSSSNHISILLSDYI